MTLPTSLEPAATAPRTLPLVPLRDMVVFPRMMAPFVVGRASSIAALEAALATPEKKIFLAAQKDPKIDEPAAGDIHETGVLASVVQSLKLPNGHIKVMVEGVVRGTIRSFSPGRRPPRGDGRAARAAPARRRGRRRRPVPFRRCSPCSSSTRSSRTTSRSKASSRRSRWTTRTRSRTCSPATSRRRSRRRRSRRSSRR